MLRVLTDEVGAPAQPEPRRHEATRHHWDTTTEKLPAFNPHHATYAGGQWHGI